MKLFENKNYLEDLHRVAEQLPEDNFSILITGATGLIGSFMVDVLLYANKVMGKSHIVYAMGRSKEKLEKRFSYALKECGLSFIEQDVMQEFPNEIQIDYIINAASNADPRTYALYPVETILTNVLGTKNALECAKESKCKKILFTSTMEVYGSQIEKVSFEEIDFGKLDFNAIRAGYPESKRVSELLCRCYVEEYNVPAVIARLGYIYGPTMLSTDNKVVAQFIRNVLRNEDIVLKSEGLQKRSYLYVADAVAAIFQILFYGVEGEAYNVSSMESVISIKDMAEIAAELGGCKVVFEFPDELEKKGFSKPQNNILSDSKLRNLNWNAYYGVRTGFKQTINILKDIEVEQ